MGLGARENDLKAEAEIIRVREYMPPVLAINSETLSKAMDLLEVFSLSR